MSLSPQFNLPEKIIGPGEFYATSEEMVISTLLGSCIAVALFDSGAKAGGLNHFMLPSPKATEDALSSTSARYGVNAMEVLINDLVKKGACKKALRAKVFGGSAMIDYEKEVSFNVPRMNVAFIFEFLETEKIPVDSYSVGGALPRKIFFFTHTAKVLMRFTKIEGTSIGKREMKYAQTLHESTANAGRPILFSGG